MSIQFLESKKEYLNQIGIIGLCLINDNKLLYTNFGIKEDEIKKITIFPSDFIKMDDIQYIYKYKNQKNINVGKFYTKNYVLGETNTGCIIKLWKTDIKEVYLIGIYSDIISPQACSIQLESMFNRLLEKKII